MVKLCIEICIISACGLGRSSSLWKPRWFAVGWIDPNSKYCTKIDCSGSPNPTWKTRFSVPMDEDMRSNLQGLSLSIQVYRKEQLFLREKLQGTATVMLKEFFDKFRRGEAPVKETGSFQLRKGNSGKPKGFVDIYVCIFEERPVVSSHSGIDESPSHLKNEICLAIEDVVSYPVQPRPQTSLFTQFGFLPSLFPDTTATTSRSPECYDHKNGPSFAALAAGALIFGDDFSNFPNGLEGRQ